MVTTVVVVVEPSTLLLLSKAGIVASFWREMREYEAKFTPKQTDRACLLSMIKTVLGDNSSSAEYAVQTAWSSMLCSAGGGLKKKALKTQ